MVPIHWLLRERTNLAPACVNVKLISAMLPVNKGVSLVSRFYCYKRSVARINFVFMVNVSYEPN